MFLKAGSSLRLHCLVSLGLLGPDQHFLDTAVLHWWVVSKCSKYAHFVNTFIIVMLAVLSCSPRFLD